MDPLYVENLILTYWIKSSVHMNTMLNTYFTIFILGFNIKPC